MRGIIEFVQAFNSVMFEGISIEYHEETGKVSRIVFAQLEE